MAMLWKTPYGRRSLLRVPAGLVRQGRYWWARRPRLGRGAPPPLTKVQLEEVLAPARVLACENGALGSSRFGFDYENPRHPRLDQLRRRYGLDGIAGTEGGDYRRAWRLADWLRCQFGYGDPQRPVARGFDALDIIERGRAGEKFRCGSISGAFIQCLLAVGVQARLLNIANPALEGHVVAEVWCKEGETWAVLDVDNNLAYDSGGAPCSALQLHRAWIGRRWQEVGLVRGPHQEVKPSDINAYGKIDFYHHFSVKMRNDWFSASYPAWHPKGSALLGDLEWVDGQTRPRADRTRVTDREEDLYWGLDRAVLSLGNTNDSPPGLKLRLATTMPWHRRFEARIDGRETPVDRPFIDWPLHPGGNELHVYAVDVCDRRGPAAKIVVELV